MLNITRRITLTQFNGATWFIQETGKTSGALYADEVLAQVAMMTLCNRPHFRMSDGATLANNSPQDYARAIAAALLDRPWPDRLTQQDTGKKPEITQLNAASPDLFHRLSAVADAVLAMDIGDFGNELRIFLKRLELLADAHRIRVPGQTVLNDEG